MSHPMIRLRQFTIEEVLSHIGKPWKLRIKGRNIHVRGMCGERMRLLGRTQECACCGVKGDHFWLEHSGCFTPHFNLYALNQHGQPVLMTLDHIIPRSKGGRTTAENIQLLCTRCNAAKKDEMLTLDQLRGRVLAGGVKKQQENERHKRNVELHRQLEKYRPLFKKHGIGRGNRMGLVRLVEMGLVHPRFQETINKTTHFQKFLEEARALKESIHEGVDCTNQSNS